MPESPHPATPPLASPLWGVPLYPSRVCPEGKLLRVRDPFTGRDGIYFHSRPSTRIKWRRRHGRGRNAPRVRCTTVSTYQPDYDRIKEAMA